MKLATTTDCPVLNHLKLQTAASVNDILAAAGLPMMRPSRRRTPDSNPGLMLNLGLMDNARLRERLDGVSLRIVPFPYGTLVLASLLTFPATPMPGRGSSPTRIYIRRAAFDQLTDSYGADRLQRLDLTAGSRGPDTVLANLQACLSRALHSGYQATNRMIAHLTDAIHCHMAHCYGGIAIPSRLPRGGLARWRLRLALSQLDECLDRGRPPLARIAASCGLSMRHFSRAFTRSTGVSPVRWSKRRRVERAKELMRSTTRSLTEISQACGFADQSHFINTFSAATGTTPARWRECSQASGGRA